MDAVLTALLNELAEVPFEVGLVLDDFHLVESREVQQGLALLVEQFPPLAHLPIGTRADPNLPLARPRARGELVARLTARGLRPKPGTTVRSESRTLRSRSCRR